MNCLGKALALSLLLAFASTAHGAPEIPGAPQSKPIVLIGGIIHPVSGPELRDGVLLFDKGKIVAVGKDVSIPADAERIDLKGQHVYPGLFDAHTELGLVEIPSVRGSVDHAETGRINPNVRALMAVNPDSELIPVTRSNGVLTVLTAPAGGLIAGVSSVIQLDGWTMEDMALKADAGMHVIWPKLMPVHTWRLDDEHGGDVAKADKSLEELRETFDKARAYLAARKAKAEQGGTPPDHDARWDALAPVFAGKLPLIISADQIQQIEAAVALSQHERVKIIILGGYDAPHCAELLKTFDVPVIVQGVTRLPQRRHDPYDVVYSLPAKLHASGIRFCIAGGGRMGNIRNLPYQAGIASAYGLPADEALKAITLYPAEILGVADRIGSLEAGKDATLIVTSGDPLETPTQVTAAFVGGRKVDLSNRQIRLWEKYREKQRRLNPPAAK